MIEQKDILADLHTHTIFSQHAYSTIKENIDVAKKNGIKYLANTDHYYHSGDETMCKNESCRIAYLENYIRPNEKDIIVISGAEFNLGQETTYWDSIKHIKWRPIGLHSWYFDIKNATLDTLYKAFELATKDNKHNAFAHIEREIHQINQSKYGIELTDEVKEFYLAMVKLAKEKDIYLEVNESSLLSNDKGNITRASFWLQLAKEYNCNLYLGTDSHYCKSVGKFQNSLDLLNKVGYSKNLILNCNQERLDNLFL